MMRLRDKSIVVTGATGIAAASARELTAQGARVFVISVDEADCLALASETGAHYAVADLRDETETSAAFASAVERFDTIDGLLAVAGGSGRKLGDGPIDTVPFDAWKATLDLNLSTSFLSAREAIRAMTSRGTPGSIVLVTSILATHPSPELFATHAYAAAKGGQIALMKSMAAYYAPRDIRVNAIAPGLVRTPMAERAFQDAATRDYSVRKQPLAGGFLEAEDVARAATFLLSDESASITGQTIAVDGGWSVSESAARDQS